MANQKLVELFNRDSKVSISNANYADKANKIVGEEAHSGNRELFGGLTTTKLRTIYAYITNVYSRVDETTFKENVSDIQYLKVKMAYEAGRECSVKNFLQKTALLDLLDSVQSYEQFMLYCRYAESLVAYFKFYGGKDK